MCRWHTDFHTSTRIFPKLDVNILTVSTWSWTSDGAFVVNIDSEGSLWLLNLLGMKCQYVWTLWLTAHLAGGYLEVTAHVYNKLIRRMNVSFTHMSAVISSPWLYWRRQTVSSKCTLTYRRHFIYGYPPSIFNATHVRLLPLHHSSPSPPWSCSRSLINQDALFPPFLLVGWHTYMPNQLLAHICMGPLFFTSTCTLS